ncbi:hypothetical protein BDV97DRAFT_66794 [Delphinella strobiligena]|nr:hypothetical protein BDV97DRAFT_66794 [Delphinella strobiligena]
MAIQKSHRKQIADRQSRSFLIDIRFDWSMISFAHISYRSIVSLVQHNLQATTEKEAEKSYKPSDAYRSANYKVWIWDINGTRHQISPPGGYAHPKGAGGSGTETRNVGASAAGLAEIINYIVGGSSQETLKRLLVCQHLLRISSFPSGMVVL